MPIVKTQDGKVVTKDGKVSCECCDVEIECIHTANFNDPTKWDPLTGAGLPPASQLELTKNQYQLLTSGGSISWSASGNAFETATQNRGGDLVLTGNFSMSMSRVAELPFIPNSCKQKEIVATEISISTSCSSNGTATGTNSEFFPYITDPPTPYPCVPFIKGMDVRLSFYNADGDTAGKLYEYGMYFQMRIRFQVNRELLFGEVGFSPIFNMLLTPTADIGNNIVDPDGFIDLVTDAGTIALPFVKGPSASASSSVTSTMIFTAAAP